MKIVESAQQRNPEQIAEHSIRLSISSSRMWKQPLRTAIVSITWKGPC